MLPEKSLEYFLSAQHWLDAFPAPRAAYYDKLVRDLNRVLDAGIPSLEKASAASAPVLGAAPAPPFAAAVLQQFELQLARQIGPIAKLLVARAAVRARNTEELRRLLAEEIESERGRRQFIAAST